MTYSYTLPTPAVRMAKTAFTAPMARTVKIGLAGLALAFLATTIIIATGPRSKPTPLATQPMVIKLVPAQAEAKTEDKAGFKIPEALTYRGIDNAVRDFQMDNAHLGHSMKMAMISDKNPIKRFFIAVDRKFSLMGILVGLAFLFTLFSFGFIRTSRDDLSNY